MYNNTKALLYCNLYFLNHVSIGRKKIAKMILLNIFPRLNELIKHLPNIYFCMVKNRRKVNCFHNHC